MAKDRDARVSTGTPAVPLQITPQSASSANPNLPTSVEAEGAGHATCQETEATGVENGNGNGRGRQPIGRQPICPYHHCECKSRRSEPYFTRYYCPRTGCSYSEKIPRPTIEKERERAAAQDEFSAR